MATRLISRFVFFMVALAAIFVSMGSLLSCIRSHHSRGVLIRNLVRRVIAPSSSLGRFIGDLVRRVTRLVGKWLYEIPHKKTSGMTRLGRPAG